MKLKKTQTRLNGLVLLLILFLPLTHLQGSLFLVKAQEPLIQTPLPGYLIPKYVDPLPTFVGARVMDTDVTVIMEEFQQKILPDSFYKDLSPVYQDGTFVWGYDVGGSGAHYPGVTVEAVRGVPTTMTYINNLPWGAESQVQRRVPVDQTLHWANPDGLEMDNEEAMDIYEGSPPTVVHLHGAEVPSEFDGGPEQWFTSDGKYGPAYRTSVEKAVAANAATYVYPNGQEPTTLWFHDHALGATRTNVYSGMAAFYLLREENEAELNLPSGKYEIELAIQDRMFDTEGQLLFPSDPALNPEHPWWQPEFFGDVMVVNGKSWPYFEVEPRQYRFRILDGSNARFLNMWLETDVKNPKPGPQFQVIGSDGGFLDKASLQRELLMGPGERYDVIVDFSGYAGKDLILRNDARMPFPNGAGVDPAVDGQIMQFRVTDNAEGKDESYKPSAAVTGLREAAGLPAMPALASENPISLVRQLTLNEEMGMAQTVDGVSYPGGPLAMFVNNTRWNGKVLETMMGGSMPMLMAPDDPAFAEDSVGNYVSELPELGTTEIWEIANLTADAHPIHLHLVQFQLLDRQRLNTRRYNKAYDASFEGGGYDHMTGDAYPVGLYIPGDGPPRDYGVENADGSIGGNPPFSRYLIGKASQPLGPEKGWEDTIIMYPGEVTRIVFRWTDQEGEAFTFDATGAETSLAVDENGIPSGGPGYVWHCHIVDHEDNEMMRPMLMR